MRTVFRTLFRCLIAILVVAPPASTDSQILIPIANGVIYKHLQYEDLYGSPQSIHLLDINLSHPDVTVHFPYALGDANGDPYRTVPQFAARVPNAVGAVNAQFFDLADQTGTIQYLRVDGKVVDQGGWTDAEQRAIAADANGRAWVALRPPGGWSSLPGVPNVMASGPDMITNGIVRSIYPNDPLFLERNPRTVVASTYENHLLLVVVDGRRAGIASGMTLPETATMLLTLGRIRHAFNFDGGGSSTLWAGGSVLNQPSGNALRAVANAVVVASKPLPNSDIVVDNRNAAVSTGWTTGTSSSDKYGSDYVFAPHGSGQNTVDFVPIIPQAGRYEVYEWHPQGTNRSAGTPHIILHSRGTNIVKVNQQGNGGRWNYIGRFHFNAGVGGRVRITDGFAEADKVAIADAIKFVRMPAENALRLHGGLASSANENTMLLDTWPGGTPTGVVTLEDAVRNARRAAGLEP